VRAVGACDPRGHAAIVFSRQPAGRLLRYSRFESLFSSREVKAHDEERMRRTGGTPQCRDTACRVRTDEECNAEIARISTVS